MTTRRPLQLNQKRLLFLALGVAVAVIGASWIAMMWGILAIRPDTSFLDFAKAEFIPSLIMILAWLRTHREIVTKGYRFGSLGWMLAGGVISWLVLNYSWGFGIDTGDATGIVTASQAGTAALYFFGGWSLSWLIYIIGIDKHEIQVAK